MRSIATRSSSWRSCSCSRLAHVSSKAGRAWAAIRQSEPAALAGGINITFYKLWAFALASFMTGVAGALLAANEGKIYHQQFRTIDSITLMAVVLMGGIFSLWGAVVAGLLQNLLPALLNDWFDFFRTNPDFLLVLFGIGVLQVLVTAPEGLVNQVPKDLTEPRAADLRRSATARGRDGARAMIEVEGLTVRFGGVTPLDDMTVEFPQGTCGLIGPNGAGKTTFFNVLSGFVSPATGTVRAYGEDLLRLADYRRARWGLRRTFQTGTGDRAPVGVRERRDDPGALGSSALRPAGRRARRTRLRRARGGRRGRKSGA